MSTIETATAPHQSADELAPPLSLRQLAWRRFRRHKLAVAGVVILILLIVYCFGGALFISEQYANHNDLNQVLQPPSAAHPFGTDTIGRDIFARTIYGGQISLFIGLTAVVIETVLGILVGALAGYYGGRLDSLLMRFTEAMIIIPQLFLLIVMAKFFGGQMPNFTIFGRTYSGSLVVIIVIIGITSWMYLARIVRAEFLSIKEREFILAARATGTLNPRRYLCAHPAQLHGGHHRVGHAERRQRHSGRSLHQFSGTGRAAAHGHVGQHAGTRLQLHRQGRAVAVVFPGAVDPVDRVEHQLSGRWYARRARSAQPGRVITIHDEPT